MIAEYTVEELEKIKQVMRKPPAIIGESDSLADEKSDKALEIKKIYKFGNVVKFAEKQTIFKEGEPGGFVYVVLSGTVCLTDIWDDEIARLEVGDILGEMDLINALPRYASAIAKTDATLFIISEENLPDVISIMPSIALRMIYTLSQKCRTLMGVATQDSSAGEKQKLDKELFYDLDSFWDD